LSVQPLGLEQPEPIQPPEPLQWQFGGFEQPVEPLQPGYVSLFKKNSWVQEPETHLGIAQSEAEHWLSDVQPPVIPEIFPCAFRTAVFV